MVELLESVNWNLGFLGATIAGTGAGGTATGEAAAEGCGEFLLVEDGFETFLDETFHLHNCEAEALDDPRCQSAEAV